MEPRKRLDKAVQVRSPLRRRADRRQKRAAVTRTVNGGVATVTATAANRQPAVQTIYVQQVTIGASDTPGGNGGINVPTITNGGVPVVTVTSVPVVTMISSQSINTSQTQVVSVGPANSQSSVQAQSAGLNGVAGSANSAMSSGNGSDGLSGGAIAGIVIGSIAGAALLLGLILLALARRRENERRALASDSPSHYVHPY